MFDIFEARVSRYRSYWSVRKFLLMQKFRVDRTLYNLKRQVKGLSLGSQIFFQLFKLGAKGILIAGLLIASLEFTEHLVKPLLSSYVPEPIRLSSQNRDFVELIGQIGATFLGIYFATFGIILSSSYTKLRGDVLSLLLNEKVNNIYSIYLIYLTVFCLLASSIGYLGFNTGYLVFLSSVIGGLVAVLCLFELGKRLFFFFDTARLVETELVPEIATTLGAIAAGHLDSIHLQAHNQKLTEQRIDTLHYLAHNSNPDDIGATERTKRINRKYAELLILYAGLKAKIPRESFWFKKRLVHPDWFLEPDSSTGIALETDTFIQPKEEPDFFWFENLVVSGLEDSIKKSIEQRDFETAQFTLRNVSFVVEKLAKSLLVDEGLDLANKFEKILDDSVSEAPELPLNEDTKNRDVNEIVLHDTAAYMTTSFAIEYLRHTILHISSLQENFEAVEWKTGNFGGLPALLSDQLQLNRNRIEFEEKVEKLRLTPSKFILQLLSKEFAHSIGETLEKIRARYQTSLVEKVENLVAVQRADLAVQVLFNALRSVNQIQYFLEMLSDTVNKLYDNEIYGDYAIERIDFDAQISAFNEMHDVLLQKLSNDKIIAFVTKDLKHNEALPDYFGQCYFKLADECYTALQKNSKNLFSKIFPAFFMLGQMASQRFAKEKEKFSSEYHVALMASVTEDLLSISGYASLYGEFWEDEHCRKIVDNVWQNYLKMRDDGDAYLEVLLSISNYKANSFTMGPRSIIRTQWSQSFEHILRDAGYGGRFDYDEGKKHPSALIRAIDTIGLHQPSYVFLAEQVTPKIDDESKYSNGLRSFLSSLEREKNRA